MIIREDQQISVLGTQVAISSLRHASQLALQLAQQQQGGYVCLANVHMCMEAEDEPKFAQVLKQAAFVVADGRPIFWAQRLLGATEAKQVRGLDLVLTLCQQMPKLGLRLGLYGGQDDSLLNQLKSRLLQQFPDLDIVYAFAPPYRPLTPEEDAEQIAAITSRQVDILLVGLGCPKQEYWMAAHRHQVSALMFGVGAAFDFIAGRKAHAPVILQRLGLEWLFRLLSEPQRLSGRYFKHNPRFVLRFGTAYIRSMISRLFGNKN